MAKRKANEKEMDSEKREAETSAMVQPMQQMPMQVHVQVPQEALNKAVENAMGQQQIQNANEQQNADAQQSSRTTGFMPYMNMNPNIPMATMMPAGEMAKPEPVVEVEKMARDWMLRCPNCGKFLKVNDKILYHRCPACTKVFQLDRGSRPYQSSLEKKMGEEMPTNTETLSEKMTQDRPIGMPEGLPDGFPES